MIIIIFVTIFDLIMVVGRAFLISLSLHITINIIIMIILQCRDHAGPALPPHEGHQKSCSTTRTHLADFYGMCKKEISAGEATSTFYGTPMSPPWRQPLPHSDVSKSTKTFSNSLWICQRHTTGEFFDCFIFSILSK